MGRRLESMENHSTTQLLEEIDRLQTRLAELQFSEIERKRAEQINQTLFSISNAVNTTFNLDELYASIHVSLSRIIDVTHLLECYPHVVMYIRVMRFKLNSLITE